MSCATHAGNDMHFKGGVFDRHHKDSDKIIVIMDPSGPVESTVTTLQVSYIFSKLCHGLSNACSLYSATL